MTLLSQPCKIEGSLKVSHSGDIVFGRGKMSYLIANKIFSRWQTLSCRKRGVLIIAIPITCLAMFPPLLAWSHFDIIEDKREFEQLKLTNSISRELFHTTLHTQREIKNYLLTRQKQFIDNYERDLVKASEIEQKLDREIKLQKVNEQTLSTYRAINDQYLREMSWILTEIQVKNSQAIDSQEWQSWLQKSDRIIADLEHRITELTSEVAIVKQKQEEHIEIHDRRGFILVCLFVLLGISGSALAIKLFFSLDHELKDQRNQLEQINTQLQRFTSNASHQLRSPMAAILSNAQVGLLTPPTKVDAIYQKLEKIIELTQDNKLLIDSLLLLARSEHLSALENAELIDLGDFLRQICDRFKQSAKKKGLNFAVSFPEESVILNAEKQLLAQVIENLLDNAQKYTPQGGKVELHLSIRASQAVIKVIDSGIGIPQSNLDKIFECFYRVDSSGKNTVKGFGLGLAIVKEIVRLHQGFLKVSSKCDLGTTVELELPIRSS